MKRLLLVLVILAMLLAACQRPTAATAPTPEPEPRPELVLLSEPAYQDNNSGYEVGRVRLVAGDTEHEPGIHFVHGAMHTENGLLSANGIPFESWLESNLDDLSVIEYSDDIQIVLDGEYGQVLTFPQWAIEYHNELRIVGLLTESFVGSVGNVSLPGDYEAYLVYVDVRWCGGGDDFTLNRYVFKVVRPVQAMQQQPTLEPTPPAQQPMTPAQPPQMSDGTPLAPPQMSDGTPLAPPQMSDGTPLAPPGMTPPNTRDGIQP